MKPPPTNHQPKSYSIAKAGKPFFTRWRTLMFMLFVINATLAFISMALVNVISIQSAIHTQQSLINSRLDAIETMVALNTCDAITESIGRSYLDGRPAVEIDRSTDDEPAYLPRAP